MGNDNTNNYNSNNYYLEGDKVKEFLRAVILIAVMGFIYMLMEIIYKGSSSPIMIAIGGLSAYFVGLLDEKNDYFYNKKMSQKCFIGMFITLAMEFSSGMILKHYNIILWDYSNLPCNLCGVICLPYAIMWFFLVPLGLFLNDRLRKLIFNEKEPRKPLMNYYKRLFNNH
jgi:uncharacterized membrane protein